jgi:hypothetical protein
MGRLAQLRQDGTPVDVDVLKGEMVSAGRGQLRVELWKDTSDKKATTFDWRCRISADRGGLSETADEFAFQAPDIGYQPSIVIDMPATNQPWCAEINKRYYIQLPDGKYGRIDLSLLAYNGVFRVQSVINPSGSRNLEPLDTPPPQAPVPAWIPPGAKAVIPEFK